MLQIKDKIINIFKFTNYLIKKMQILVNIYIYICNIYIQYCLKISFLLKIILNT